jgi:YggT family protein
MSEYHEKEEESVDRRAETVITQEPGYAATEQVSRNLAAERRLRTLQINRILFTLLGILEILLGLRFVLKLIAANPASGFATFIYGITAPFMAPFTTLVATPRVEGAVLEITTLIAMAVYALFFWVLARIVLILTDRPTARTVTRTAHDRARTGPNDPTSPTHPL